MNIVLGIISIALCFGVIVLLEKFFKKEGLYIWISIATIIANILVCKTINVLGFTSSLGNIMFASVFLASDILTEKYGSEHSKKAVLLGMISAIIFVISTQISLLYIPDSTDLAQSSMTMLFGINLRTSIASLSMYFISNIFGIWIFEKIKSKIPDKLWIRNNVSTIIANCSENYCFAFIAFIGLMDIPTILSIATVGSILEIMIAICDTPFLYIATKNK